MGLVICPGSGEVSWGAKSSTTGHIFDHADARPLIVEFIYSCGIKEASECVLILFAILISSFVLERRTKEIILMSETHFQKLSSNLYLPNTYISHPSDF